MTANTVKPADDAQQAAAVAWRRFSSLVEALPPDQAAPLWQQAQVQAAAYLTGSEVRRVHQRAHDTRQHAPEWRASAAGLLQWFACWHHATVDADFFAGDVVLKSLEPRMVCSRCGLIGADVRPNWSDRPERETMVGPNFRG